MKSVLISIKPKWVEKITSGEKTIEVRKTAPKCEVPFKAYIYCTKEKKQDDIIWAGVCGDRGKWNGRVIGEFVCDKVYSIKNQGGRFVVANEEQSVTNEIARQSCLDYDDMVSYFGNKDGFGWHISDLKIYDKPKELSEFSRPCSYSGLCFSCKRTSFKKDGNLLCNTKITRPPQSWMHVEDLGEEK